MRYTVEGFTPGTRSRTRRATSVGLMWPSVDMISDTMARRWGVIRSPRDRRTSRTDSAVAGIGSQCSVAPLHLQYLAPDCLAVFVQVDDADRGHELVLLLLDFRREPGLYSRGIAVLVRGGPPPRFAGGPAPRR